VSGGFFSSPRKTSISIKGRTGMEKRKTKEGPWAQVIAKALADEDLKSQLLANPAAVLKAEGIDVPSGVEIKVLENTEKVFHLVLPTKPIEFTDEELSEDDLVQVAGGLTALKW
jgi:hypothetical protein